MLQRLLSPEASADLCYDLAKEANIDNHVSTCKEVLRKLDMLMPQAIIEVTHVSALQTVIAAVTYHTDSKLTHVCMQLRKHQVQEILDFARRWTEPLLAQQPSGMHSQPDLHSVEASCLAMQVCPKALAISN